MKFNLKIVLALFVATCSNSTMTNDGSSFTFTKDMTIQTLEHVGKWNNVSRLILDAPCPGLPESWRERICTPESKFYLCASLEPIFFYKKNNEPVCAFVNFTNGPGKIECNGEIYNVFLPGAQGISLEAREKNRRAFETGFKNSPKKDLFDLVATYADDCLIIPELLDSERIPWLVTNRLSNLQKERLSKLQNESRCNLRGMECVENGHLFLPFIKIQHGRLRRLPMYINGAQYSIGSTPIE
ncbi:hypothetical protein HOD08_02845 [bacterium]|jgi:hypothetical protein|nr:hypothetical protein [bacterium]